MDGRGKTMFRIPSETKDFAPGPTHAPVYWQLRAILLGVKRPKTKADHSPPSSVDIKNESSYASTSLCAFVTSTGIT